MTYLQLTSQKHTTNLYSSFVSAEIYHNLVKRYLLPWQSELRQWCCPVNCPTTLSIRSNKGQPINPLFINLSSQPIHHNMSSWFIIEVFSTYQRKQKAEVALETQNEILYVLLNCVPLPTQYLKWKVLL